MAVAVDIAVGMAVAVLLGIVRVAISTCLVTTGCVAVAEVGSGEASALATDVAEGGVVVTVGMTMASAGGRVGVTTGSCLGPQAARERKRKKTSTT
jgi:hypothetical protein